LRTPPPPVVLAVLSLPPAPPVVDVLVGVPLAAPAAPLLAAAFVEPGGPASPQPENVSAARARIFQDIFMRDR